jgi:outer membrane protein
VKRLIGLSSGVCTWVGAGVLAFGGVAVAAAVPARAQALRVAVVNYGELLQKSPQAQAASAALRKEFEPKQKSLQAQAHRLQQKQAQLKRNAATMTQDQRDQAELTLREQSQDLTHTLVQVVQKYAHERNYNLVLADGVIYADSALDITPQILKVLQSQVPAHGTHK